MARPPISQSTIKKIFGLSGNQCAFTDCVEELVTPSSTIIGEMCHIEGYAPKSARHNPTLSPEQVNDESNFITLCPKHHKIIDSEKSTYTVEVLQQMKKVHEDKFRGQEYSVTDDIIEKLEKFYQQQFNINVGSGDQIINQNFGITSISDSEKLFELLFNQNFPKLKEESQKIAQKCAEEFCQEFMTRAKNELKDEDIQKLAEPDIQYVLTQSIMQAGRRDDKTLRENLGYLIVERIKNSNNNLKSLVYNEAIETIGKLTIDGLKIIAICFILKYTRWTDINSIEDLNDKIKLVEPLFDFKNTATEFQHLVYAGCCELGIGSWNYVNNLGESYHQIFPLLLDEKDLVGHTLTPQILRDLFTNPEDGDFSFKIIDGPELNKYLESKSYPAPQKKEILKHFSKAKGDLSKKIGEIAQQSKEITKANDLIMNSDLQHLTLTSVGIAIGAMYYEKITGGKINIDIWIN